MYNFSKANDITDNAINNIYNNNKSKIVYLNSIYNMGTVTSANGFFIDKGIIVTTYNYIEKTLMKAQNIIISDSLENVYKLEGIVTINEENDIAVLKVKEEENSYIQLNDSDKKQKEDAVITINSKTGVGLTASKGIIISNDKNIQTSIPITEELQGSPLFDVDGNLIGMINSKTVNTSISYATNIDIIKEYYSKLSAIKHENIKSVSFQELKNRYYIQFKEENEFNNIPENKWNEYLKVENAKDLIKLKLIKGSYKDGIITLRFKNDILDYIDTMQFTTEYINNLKNKGYIEKLKTDSKTIYENGKNKIIIMKEFDYLIIVMVKL